jgi:hypothetical protein
VIPIVITAVGSIMKILGKYTWNIFCKDSTENYYSNNCTFATRDSDVIHLMQLRCII